MTHDDIKRAHKVHTFVFAMKNGSVAVVQMSKWQHLGWQGPLPVRLIGKLDHKMQQWTILAWACHINQFFNHFYKQDVKA